MINYKACIAGIILGIAGTLGYQGCTKDVKLSKEEYSKLRQAYLEIQNSKIFDDEWSYSDLCTIQRDRLSDIIRAAAANGCKHVIKTAWGFGYNFEVLGYWSVPDYYHDITIKVDSLNHWSFCY